MTRVHDLLCGWRGCLITGLCECDVECDCECSDRMLTSDVCLEGPFDSIESKEDFDLEMLPVFDKEDEKSPERSDATVLTLFPSLEVKLFITIL